MTRRDKPIPPVSTRRERRAEERREGALRGARVSRSVARRPARRPAWQSPIVLVSFAAFMVVAVIVGLNFVKPAGSTGELTQPTIAYPAGMTDGETLGSANAPVTIELYSDFQCPICKRFVTEELGRLVTEFVADGTLRIVARDIAIVGSGSPNESIELGAGAACAARQNRYWQFHDLVFWNQGRENRGDHNAAFIARVADAAGVDRTAWDACNRETAPRATIASQTSSAFALQINSTPTLVINGQKRVGLPDYSLLASLIRQLAAAASPAPSIPAGPSPS